MYQFRKCNKITGSYDVTLTCAFTTGVIFPVTRVNLYFKALSDPLLNLWGAKRDFSELLKLLVTLKRHMLSI